MTHEPIYCANPECGEEVVGFCILMADATDSIDWQGFGIKHVLHTTLEDGTPNQSLVMHQNCFLELFNAIMRGEHTVILNVVGCPVGELKEEVFG